MNMLTRCLRGSNRHQFLLCAMISSIFVTTLTETMFTEDQMQRLDQFIENIIKCRSTPGLVVSVVRGEETFTKAYGKADVKNNIHTTTDSIFCLASLTKAFTATLLANILPEQFPETLWDTRVRDILGDEFRFVDDVRTELTTLKDLLSHRTGLIRGDLGIYGGYPYTVTREEMVHRLKHLEARYDFRDRLLYNNWMYMLAGYIAEVLSGGQSWEQLILRKVLLPLGMDSTIFLDNLQHYVNTTLALPYRVVDGEFHPFPLEHYSFHPEQPAASICSTGNDMLKWMQFLLGIKSFGMVPANLANTSAFHATMMPHMVMDTFGFNPPLPGNPHSHGFGFGWVIGSYRGQRLVNHVGALLASSSLLWLLPNQNIGVFVAANRQARDPVLGLIAYFLADLTSGETPWLNLTTSCTFPEPWRDPPPPAEYPNKTHSAQRPLAHYTGTYGNKLFGDFQVFTKRSPEARLEIQYGEHFEGFLIPSEAKDTFSVKFTGVYWFLTHKTPIPDALGFIESEDGKLQYLTFIMQQEIITFNKCVRFNGYSSSARQIVSSTVIYLSISLLLVTWQLWCQQQQQHSGKLTQF